MSENKNDFVKQSIVKSLKEINNHLTGKEELPTVEDSIKMWEVWVDENED